MEILIKNLRGVELPEKFDVGDWIDLRAAEDTSLKKAILN